MKNSNKFLLMALLCLLNSSIFSQPLLKVNEFTPQLVFNYENKLRIVWPIQFSCWSNSPKFESIIETKGYIKTVLGMISKIESELDGSETLTINLFLDKKFNEIKISKGQTMSSFTFRDSILEFSGKHLLQINDGKKWPVQIYFNSIEQLTLLEKIDFVGFKDFVEKDLANVKAEKVQKAKEIIYLSNNGELSRYAQIGRDKLQSVGFQGMFGSMLAFDHIGLGLDLQWTLLKYTKGNSNEKQLSHKLALNLKSFFWDGMHNEFDAIYSSLGLDFSTNQRLLGSSSPIDLVGLGLGVYSMEGMKGYNMNFYDKDPHLQPLTSADNLSQGIYFSIIAELRKLYISLDFNTSFKVYNDTRSSFSSFTLGYKF